MKIALIRNICLIILHSTTLAFAQETEDLTKPERAPYRLYNRYWGEAFHRAGLGSAFGVYSQMLVDRAAAPYYNDVEIRNSFLLPQLKIFNLRDSLAKINKELVYNEETIFHDPEIEYFDLNQKLLNLLLGFAPVSTRFMGRDITEDETLWQSLDIDPDDRNIVFDEIDYDRAAIIKFGEMASNQRIKNVYSFFGPKTKLAIEEKEIHIRADMWMNYIQQLLITHNKLYKLQNQLQLFNYRQSVSSLEELHLISMKFIQLLHKNHVTRGADSTWIEFGNEMKTLAIKNNLDLSWMEQPMYKSGETLNWVNRIMHEVLLDLEIKINQSHDRYISQRICNIDCIDRVAANQFHQNDAVQFHLIRKKKKIETQLILAELQLYNIYASSIGGCNDTYAPISLHHWWPAMFNIILSQERDKAWEAYQNQ